jgi:hypothetical protein
MLNYYRKKQIRNIFNELKIKNKDIDLIKINKKNYKFTINNNIIFITKLRNKKYYFNYNYFELNDKIKELYPIRDLLINNKNIIKIIKKHG